MKTYKLIFEDNQEYFGIVKSVTEKYDIIARWAYERLIYWKDGVCYGWNADKQHDEKVTKIQIELGEEAIKDLLSLGLPEENIVECS